MDINGIGLEGRIERLRTAMDSTPGPWELLPLDMGAEVAQLTPFMASTSFLALYVAGGENGELGDPVVSYLVVDKATAVPEATLASRVRACNPTLAALSRMQVQRTELGEKAAEFNIKDDQELIAKVFRTALDTIGDPALPIAMCRLYMFLNGREHLVFAGCNGVPLYEMWGIFKAVIMQTHPPTGRPAT